MRRNQKGSVILWAIVVIMVLIITVGAALTISYSYYNRTIMNNNQRQAYLTSKGTIEDLANKIVAGNNDYLILFKDLKPGESTNLTITMDPSISLGDVAAKIEVKDPKNADGTESKGKITITVTTTYVEQHETIKADLQLGRIGDTEHWQLVRYYKGEPIDAQVDDNVKAAMDIYNTMMSMTDAYYGNNKSMSAVLEVIKSQTDRYENLLKGDKEWKLYSYFNNDNVRKPFYYWLNSDGGWIEFDKTQVKNKELAKKLTEEHYYIQPFFNHSLYKVNIVFASSNSKCNTSWNDVHLIFDPETQGWYYIDKVKKTDFADKTSEDDTKLRTLTMPMFNDKGDTTPGDERWLRFKAKYLTEENRLN